MLPVMTSQTMVLGKVLFELLLYHTQYIRLLLSLLPSKYHIPVLPNQHSVHSLVHHLAHSLPYRPLLSTHTYFLHCISLHTVPEFCTHKLYYLPIPPVLPPELSVDSQELLHYNNLLRRCIVYNLAPQSDISPYLTLATDQIHTYDLHAYLVRHLNLSILYSSNQMPLSVVSLLHHISAYSV